jgi:VanZ family protein
MGAAPRNTPPLSVQARYGLLTLIFVTTIYWLSSQPDFGVAGRGAVARTASKLAHVLLYAGLAFCLLRALAGGRPRSQPSWALSGLTVLVAGGLGALDEWHQSFVLGRSASAGDVILDLAGAGAMVVGMRLTAARAKTRADRPEGAPVPPAPPRQG